MFYICSCGLPRVCWLLFVFFVFSTFVFDGGWGGD